MVANFHDAQCCAVTRSGKRCRGGWASAQVITFAWDAVAAVGVDGPNVVLCWRHRDMRERSRPQRIRVIHGWLGGANKYDYGVCVFRGPALTEWRASTWWWKHRRPCRSGDHRSAGPTPA